MACSPAQLESNARNSLKSTGPVTPEGKEQSRRNGLKHGLTGRGIVVSEEDQAEVDARIDAFRADMKPKTAAGLILIARMAMLSVREERCARQEIAATAFRVRHAVESFDEEQADRANRLFDALEEDMRNNRRRLLGFPEGVDRMLDEWSDLRADLEIVAGPRWTANHLVRAGRLMGLKEEHVPSSNLGACSREFWEVPDGGPMNEGPGQAALSRLIEQVDVEIAALEEHCETLDFQMAELDRAEAGDRALFDASKAASLARRYESEARREFSKALKDFRLVEAEAIVQAPPATIPPKPPQPLEPASPLGSRRETAPTPARDPVRTSPEAPRSEIPMAMGPDGRPIRLDTPSRPPG